VVRRVGGTMSVDVEADRSRSRESMSATRWSSSVKSSWAEECYPYCNQCVMAVSHSWKYKCVWTYEE